MLMDVLQCTGCPHGKEPGGSKILVVLRLRNIRYCSELGEVACEEENNSDRLQLSETD